MTLVMKFISVHDPKLLYHTILPLEQNTNWKKTIKKSLFVELKVMRHCLKIL